jgi:hypothetical protein
MRIRRAVVSTVPLVMLAATAQAVPRTGERFPSVTAEDLTGQVHSTDELVGRRAFVVAITTPGAGNAARGWLVAAEAQIPSNVARQSLVSLHLPFFISTPYALGKAREQVPRQHWQATLLDRGNMAKQLGLGNDKVPYIFVLDETGRVVAAVHATVDAPQAAEIWNAIAAPP